MTLLYIQMHKMTRDFSVTTAEADGKIKLKLEMSMEIVKVHVIKGKMQLRNLIWFATILLRTNSMTNRKYLLTDT